MYQQNSAGSAGSPFSSRRYVVTPPTANAKVPVLSHPTSNVKIVAQLSSGTVVQALSQQGSWLRIQLPQGEIGYIAAASAHLQQRSAASIPLSREEQIRRQYDARSAGASAPQSQSDSLSQVEYATKPQSNGAKIAAIILLLILSGFALLLGIIASSTVEENCSISIFFGAASQNCQIVSHPYAVPGDILLALGILGLLAAILVSIKMRSKRS